MRKLRVSERDLMFALTNRQPETPHFLDLESGSVIPVFAYNRETVLEQFKQNPHRYLRLAPLSGHQSFVIMERFTRTVSRPQLRSRLVAVLDGDHAFSRFRAVLREFPAELKRWRQFRTVMTVQGLRERLLALGIELELVADEKQPVRGDEED
ncbi:MAG: UPF0158 family protein [candidate division WOR-3 bacterium]